MNFGPFAVRAQYGDFKSGFVNGAASSDIKSAGIGLDWKITEANKLNISFYDAKDNGTGGAVPVGGKTREIALLDTYSLSKRTQVYAQVVSVKADANAGNSAVIGGIAPGVYAASEQTLGSSTLSFGVGMQHSF